MKIFQINATYRTGSTGRIMEEINRIITNNNYSGYVAYNRNFISHGDNFFKIGGKVDFFYHVFLTRFFDKHGLASKKSTFSLINEIKLIKPDIIHLHNIHGYYLNYDLFFKFLSTLNIPIIWTLHDCWSFTGHCAHFSFINCNKWKIQCEKCPQLKTYPASFFVDNSKNNFIKKKICFNSIPNLTIVSVSDWLDKIVKESFLQNIKHKRIYNGIDISIFKYSDSKDKIKNKYKICSDKILLGVASIWTKKKGLNDYYNLRKILSDDISIILLGLTKKQIRKLPKGIIGISRTDNIYELVDLYSTADITLNLSYEETFGLTTIEGMSCGTPGIVYNCTASPELISESTGLIVEPGNILMLNEAINTILNKGKEYYFSKCRQRVEDLFNIEDRHQEYMNLYDSLLNCNN